MSNCLIVSICTAALIIGGVQSAALMMNMPQITKMEVQCAKSGMTVDVEFDLPFDGIIFSKGHFSDPACRYVGANSNVARFSFSVPMQGCGTTNESDNNNNMASNVIVIQNDAVVQEIWDSAQKLSCRWTDRVTKTVSVRPLTIDMLEATEAKFNNAQEDVVDVWMDLQQGKWPSSGPIDSAVRIGQELSLIVGLNDPSGQMDLQVMDCYAHSTPELTDPSAFRVQLTDDQGCVIKSKLIGPFESDRSTTGRYAGNTVKWAPVSAFSFPDNMQVFTSCNVEVCKGSCPSTSCQPAENNPSGSALFPEPDTTTTKKTPVKATDPPATLAPATTRASRTTLPPKTAVPTTERYTTEAPTTTQQPRTTQAPSTTTQQPRTTLPLVTQPPVTVEIRTTQPPVATTQQVRTTPKLTTQPPPPAEITFPSLDYLPPFPVKPVTPRLDCDSGSTDPLCSFQVIVPSQPKFTLPPNITPPTTTLEPPPPPPPTVTAAPYVCQPGSDDPRCPGTPPIPKTIPTTPQPCYQGSDSPDCLDRNPKEEQLPILCLPGSRDPDCGVPLIPGGSNESPVTLTTARTVSTTLGTTPVPSEGNFGTKIKSDGWKGDPSSHAFHMFHFQRGDGRRGGRKIPLVGGKSKRSVLEVAQVRLTRSVRVLPAGVGVDPVSSSVEYFRQPQLSTSDEPEAQTFCVTAFSLMASASLIVVAMFGLIVIVVFLAVKYNSAKKQLDKLLNMRR